MKLFSKAIMAGTAAIMLYGSAFAQSAPPKLRFCSGVTNGVYEYSGIEIKKFADGHKTSEQVDFEVINTAGSNENLDRLMNGGCDAAIVQNDALNEFIKKNQRALSMFERTAIVYREGLHLVCNKKVNVSKISKLPLSTVVAIGMEGSGSATTWQSIKNVDPKHFEKIQIDSRSGLRALSAVDEGTDVQCMLSVTGLGNGLFKEDAKNFKNVNLVAINSDLDTLKDSRGRPLYVFDKIPDDTYTTLMPSGFFGKYDVNTAFVDAIIVTSSSWIKTAGSPRYDVFIRDIANARPAIEKRAYNKK